LRIHELPFEAPTLDIGMQWHRHNTADAAHSWFRKRVKDIIAAMPSYAATPALMVCW